MFKYLIMQKPPQLIRGDRVRIALPASPVRPEMFQQGLASLRAIGLEPVHGDIHRKWRYLAGDDTERRAELIDALSDASSKAIFFARGGYGSLRLLTDLQALRRQFEPKILLGCSDITTLHLYFQRIHDWIVFHGPMTSGDFARGQAHLPSLQQALFQTGPYSLAPDGVQILQDGEMTEGTLTGGCLSLLEAAVGTAWEPDWNDAILFMEDVA
ncbi:MAG TPA: LD-carboxypeptidase, partial [Acidobacteriota bacterium]